MFVRKNRKELEEFELLDFDVSWFRVKERGEKERKEGKGEIF